jgi:hypothetical protein
MAEPRSRRTGEFNQELVKIRLEAMAMRETIAQLEARVAHLESELSTLRGARPSAGPGPRSSKKPPPLPAIPNMPPLPRQSSRKSIVDISEIAELIESVPPGPPRPRKR